MKKPYTPVENTNDRAIKEEYKEMYRDGRLQDEVIKAKKDWEEAKIDLILSQALLKSTEREYYKLMIELLENKIKDR